MPTPQLITSQY